MKNRTGIRYGLAVLLVAVTGYGILELSLRSAEAESPSRQQVLDRLDWMRQNQRGMWNVVPEEGRFLHDLIVENKVQRVLEVGTSNGYSGIWMALALGETGGRMTTLEFDEGRAGLARENFRRTGMDGRVELILGDAMKTIPLQKGPFDLVFLDAAKDQYIDYLDYVLPMVRPGGFIVAHNVESHKSQLLDFLPVSATTRNWRRRSRFSAREASPSAGSRPSRSGRGDHFVANFSAKVRIIVIMKAAEFTSFVRSRHFRKDWAFRAVGRMPNWARGI